MTLTALAIKDPAALLALVAKLRKAGVVKLGALVLGPEPREHHASERAEADPDAVAKQRHATMFAASRIQPPFVAPMRHDAPIPRILVQRQRADEAANGTKSQR